LKSICNSSPGDSFSPGESNFSKMNYNNFDKLAPWVESIRFDQQKGRWIAQFFPSVIVEECYFKKIVESLNRHVINEIIILVADSLGISADKIQATQRRDPEITDARQVAAIIISDYLPGLPYRVIGQTLGWKNHCMVHHSRNNSGVPEIAKKVRHVYARFPILNSKLNSF